MIVATNQCGCPPKKQDPPCSPCCVPNQREKSKPEIGCSSSKNLKSILSRPKIQESSCCPIKPPEPEKIQVRKIHSEIAARGLPYKELEAIINDNKLVLRTQKEPPTEEFDPPCDCTEDPRSKVIREGKEQSQISDNRTLTLFPRDSKVGEENGTKQRTVEEPRPPTRSLEENPNIFRLRVKKTSKNGQNIDFEFRTPRPWSAEMMAKHEQALLEAIKSQECETKEDKDEVIQEKKMKKKRRRRSRSRKKKDECGEILAKPPCGQIKKRKSGNC
ncbi:uncharacterized protein LOC143216428 [Lasioglossum baleicum]|uniref:uncharacterized protein LOC143216428 n=1 Tax=Lasioglossum baleicum TaxID=434251 RepID=UPI003FCC554E